jgi:hypothetical protein
VSSQPSQNNYNVYSIIVFVKNPVEGRVKTRIAATVGHAKAVEVYTELLHHTRQVIEDFLEMMPSSPFFRVQIYYGDELNTNDLWDTLPVQKFLQKGADLGERMYNAFAQEFATGAKRVVIIGSDCFGLKPIHLKNAFDQLTAQEAVIGPAIDGGYYLLGLKRMHPSVFQNKSWSQPILFEETLAALKHYPIVLLQSLSDIDTWEDYLAAKG